MAIFTKFVVAVWTLATIAAAVPMNMDMKMNGNLRREVSTVTETAYTTVDVSVELIVDQNGVPLQTIVPSGVAPVATTTTGTDDAIGGVAAPTIPPAQSQQVVSSAAAPSLPPTTFATMTSAITTQAVVPSAPPAAPSTSTVAAAPPAASPSSGAVSSRQILASSTNTCTGTSDACSGDITHFDGGLGACGNNVNTLTDFAVALPWEFMGTQSNGNQYCGRTLTIHNPTTGAEVQAVVQDKCMGCSGRSIDLTDALFDAIAPSCDGRCSGFEWWFN